MPSPSRSISGFGAKACSSSATSGTGSERWTAGPIPKSEPPRSDWAASTSTDRLTDRFRRADWLVSLSYQIPYAMDEAELQNILNVGLDAKFRLGDIALIEASASKRLDAATPYLAPLGYTPSYVGRYRRPASAPAFRDRRAVLRRLPAAPESRRQPGAGDGFRRRPFQVLSPILDLIAPRSTDGCLSIDLRSTIGSLSPILGKDELPAPVETRHTRPRFPPPLRSVAVEGRRRPSPVPRHREGRDPVFDRPLIRGGGGEIARANAIDDPSKLRAGMRLLIPRDGNARVRTRFRGRGNPLRVQKYKVVKGDTLFSIARTFGVGLDALRSVNKMRSTSVIKPGETSLHTGEGKAAAQMGPRQRRRPRLQGRTHSAGRQCPRLLRYPRFSPRARRAVRGARGACRR